MRHFIRAMGRDERATGWRLSCWVGAALSVLLAACGGGDGTDAGPTDGGRPEDGARPRDAEPLPRDATTPDAGPTAPPPDWTPPTPSAWTAPIGIPEPAFGIREEAPARPDPWASEVTGAYYVDNTHAAATDDANPYGTPARPRLTIPSSLSAGDRVWVAGGPYDGDLDLTATGTPDDPVLVTAADPSDRPRLTGAVSLAGSYLIFEQLELFGPSVGVRVRTPSDHIAVRYLEVHGATGRGAGLYTGRWNPEDDPATATQIVFFGNELYDLGDWRATFDEDHHAIAIGHHADHIWILDNLAYHVSGDGTQVNAKKAYLAPTLHHVYIGRNQAYENKQTGFWTKQAEDVIFSQNRVWSMRPSDSSEGVGLGWQYGPERVWFLFNEVWDCENGIKSSTNQGDEDGVAGAGEHVYLIGNRIWDIHRSDGSAPDNDPWQYGVGIRMTDQLAMKHLVANTIADVDVGITYARGTGGLQLANNILANVRGNHLIIDTREAADAASVVGMLFDPAAQIRWVSGPPMSLSEFVGANPSLCAGCVEGAPAFVDAASGDLHLAAGSPAIDAGDATTEVYDTFSALYGIDILVDVDREPRTSGSAPDIGADER